MIVCYTTKELKEALSKTQGHIGLVPTMGALHDGHLELVKASQKENDIIVVSIFVNPAQFNKKEDLKNYPTRLSKDLELLAEMKVDIVFVPNAEEMYPHGYRYQIREKEFSKVLEGEHRPGHFEGVLTIVMKLMMVSKATNAYFGKKDYQQYKLIKEMAEAFFLPVNIKGVETVREKTGLAMSSRNLRLSEKGKEKAALLYQELKNSKDLEASCSYLEKEGFEVDYLKEFGKRRYIAASIEKVRLIDNVSL